MPSGSVFTVPEANEGQLVPTQGTLSATNSAVAVTASGQTWATALMVFDAVFNGTVQPEYSIDGGTNWISAPYAKRLDASTANPAVQATVSPAAAAQTWEVPLPGDCTNFRARATSVTASGNVLISGGKYFTPGVPVVAVLYDVTSGTNASQNTGTLTLTGWTSAEHLMSSNGGTPSHSVAEVDDAGTTLASIVTGTANFMGGMGPGLVAGGTAGLAAATAQVPLPRRAIYTSGAIVGQTSRIRVVARR